MATTTTEERKMNTADNPTPRQFLKQNLGRNKVWIAYGQTEIEGYVLTVNKHFTEIQDATDGHIAKIALMAIAEGVEC